jgi:hypothetical protein
MRLVAASFESDELDGSRAPPSIKSLTPTIGIDLAAGLETGGRVGVAIANNLSGGQAGDAWSFAAPAARSRWRSAGAIGKAILGLH